MTEHELSKLREICIELGKIMQKYGGKYYTNQIKALYDIVKCIDTEVGNEEKKGYILSKYKVLYPVHGGISDFYIQNDDFATRIRLNEPLDILKKDLWIIFKQYI